jgi:hypothetical protein
MTAADVSGMDAMPRLYEVAGAGQYGCVLRPHLPCKEDEDKGYDTSTIGKAFLDEESAAGEEDANRAVATVDVRGDFTVPLIRSCIAKKSPEAERALKLCPRNLQSDLRTQYSNEKLVQHVMKDAGVDINVLNADWAEMHHRSPCDIICALGNLARGLKSLHDNGSVHMDIKPGNVMYDVHANKMRLIDFGLYSSANTAKVLSYPIKTASAFIAYGIYPPELAIAWVVAARVRESKHMELDAALSEIVVPSEADLDFMASCMKSMTSYLSTKHPERIIASNNYAALLEETHISLYPAMRNRGLLVERICIRKSWRCMKRRM